MIGARAHPMFSVEQWAAWVGERDDTHHDDMSRFRDHYPYANGNGSGVGRSFPYAATGTPVLWSG
jgi:hypothetical protein